MNLNMIKRVYLDAPNFLKRPLLKVPFAVFCGNPYREQISHLRSQRAITVGSELHLALLFKFVNDCIRYVPYYKNTATDVGLSEVNSLEDFRKLPLLTKADVRNNLDRLHNRDFAGPSYKVSTGGSSGKQLHFLMSNRAYSREWAFFSRFLSDRGININSKRISLRGVDGIDPESLIGYNFLYKELLISPFRLTEEELLKNFEDIEHFGATWIHGYPSTVNTLARLILSSNLSIPNIQNVVLVSEQIYPEHVATIKKAFNCPIHTFYGASERVIFAEDINGEYAPNPLYGYTELIDNELVGTGFVNEATPLIRYRSGDEARASVSENGSVLKIHEITGRWGKEFLIGAKGQKIYSTALNLHSDALDRISQYQFYQSQPGVCELRIVPDSTFEEGDGKNVAGAFQAKVGHALVIEPKVVDQIDLSPRGKHKYIINNLL